MEDGEERREEKKTCWTKITSALALTNPGATPINWSVVLLIVVALFASCYSITYLFPFLPDMVLYFGYKEEEKGYFVGLMASSMFAGRIFGSYFWGWLSDKKGRRPVILWCLVVVGLSNIGFGLATNIITAISFRFLCGLFNGIVGSAKTVLYEASDNSNQAASISFISVAWGAGIISGPLISGYIAQPAERFPGVFSASGIFGQHPFLLPSVVATVIPLIAAVLVFFFLPETLYKREKPIIIEVNAENKDKDQVEMKSLLHSPEAVRIPSRQVSRLKQEELRFEPAKSSGASSKSIPDVRVVKSAEGSARGSKALVRSVSSVEGQARSRVNSRSSSQTTIYLAEYGVVSCENLNQSHSCLHKRPRNTLSESQMENSTENNVNLNMIRSLSGSTTSKSVADKDLERDVEAMPIDKSQTESESTSEPKTQPKSPSCCKRIKKLNFFLLMGEKEVAMSVWIYTILSFGTIGFDDVFTIWASTDPAYSGLGFTTEKIGNAIGLSSIPLVILQVYLFPFLESRLGSKKLFYCLCPILIINCMLIPSLRAVQSNTVLFWTLLMVLMGFNKVVQTSCFSANGLHINNSVPPHLAGSVNGIAMTLTAIGRTIAPVLGGSVFAWSITHGVNIGFPFDVNMVFIIFSFTYLITNILCALLPDTLDKQKKKQG